MSVLGLLDEQQSRTDGAYRGSSTDGRHAERQRTIRELGSSRWSLD